MRDFGFHLLFLHLCFLFQALELCLVALDDFVSLCQLAILFMYKIIFGKEVAIQSLEHRLHRVGFNRMERRTRESTTTLTAETRWS